MKLSDMPDSVVEKAKKRLKKNPEKYLYRYRADALPTNTTTKEVFRRKVLPVESGSLDALIKRLQAAAVAAKKKGATQTLVRHKGIEIMAERPETQREFERRYEDEMIEHATVLLAREAREKKVRNERKAKTEEERMHAMTQFQQVVRKLGFTESKKIIEGLINGAG